MSYAIRITFAEHGLRYSTGQVYSCGELRAFLLIGSGSGSDSIYSPHHAGNEIIALAEQIKAERAIMAMEKL